MHIAYNSFLGGLWGHSSLQTPSIASEGKFDLRFEIRNCIYPGIHVHVASYSHFGGLWGCGGLQMTLEAPYDLRFELDDLNILCWHVFLASKGFSELILRRRRRPKRTCWPACFAAGKNGKGATKSKNNCGRHMHMPPKYNSPMSKIKAAFAFSARRTDLATQRKFLLFPPRWDRCASGILSNGTKLPVKWSYTEMQLLFWCQREVWSHLMCHPLDITSASALGWGEGSSKSRKRNTISKFLDVTSESGFCRSHMRMPPNWGPFINSRPYLQRFCDVALTVKF